MSFKMPSDGSWASRVELWRGDPAEFARGLLVFNPNSYQERLLRDSRSRIAVVMSRQAGKTTTLAVRAIWFSATHPETLTLIVTPSLRQSMIVMDKVHGLIDRIPRPVRRLMAERLQRTVVRFRNRSMIVALPNSPNLLRGYTAHQVICDEASFFRDDETVFYGVLYPMLSTTGGALIVSSTPWGRDSVFYKMCHSPDFSKHMVGWEEVVESGLIKPEFIEEMRRQLPSERFRMEFEVQFVEDADTYLSQDLIKGCIDPELESYRFEARPQGEFYAGVDFGKSFDHSAVVVVERCEGGVLRVVHNHRFPLETPYASVVGYVKALSEGYRGMVGVFCDQSGVGEYIVEDMGNAGIGGVEGVVLTLQMKQEILGHLKQQMQLGLLRLPYDRELVAELNVERYEFTRDGQIKFSHPRGTHDDRLWALALAAFATRTRPDRSRPISKSF